MTLFFIGLYFGIGMGSVTVICIDIPSPSFWKVLLSMMFWPMFFFLPDPE